MLFHLKVAKWCLKEKQFMFRAPILVSFLILIAVESSAQSNFHVELGAGAGSFTNHKYSLGKGELHLGLLKNLNGTFIGLDFSTGGDLLWGELDEEMIGGRTRIDPYSTQFASILALYRRGVLFEDRFFIQSGIGYSSLHRFIHADDTRKVQASNLGVAFGVGYTLDQMIFTLRYQFYGKTPSYEGTRDGVDLYQERRSVSLVMFRVSGKLDISKVFNRSGQ